MGSLHDAILDSVGITAILVPHRINVFSQRELYVRNLAPSGVSNGICVQTFKSIQMISAMRCCAVIARVLLFSKGVGTCWEVLRQPTHVSEASTMPNNIRLTFGSFSLAATERQQRPEHWDERHPGGAGCPTGTGSQGTLGAVEQPGSAVADYHCGGAQQCHAALWQWFCKSSHLARGLPTAILHALFTIGLGTEKGLTSGTGGFSFRSLLAQSRQHTKMCGVGILCNRFLIWVSKGVGRYIFLLFKFWYGFTLPFSWVSYLRLAD